MIMLHSFGCFLSVSFFCVSLIIASIDLLKVYLLTRCNPGNCFHFSLAKKVSLPLEGGLQSGGEIDFWILVLDWPSFSSMYLAWVVAPEA